MSNPNCYTFPDVWTNVPRICARDNILKMNSTSIFKKIILIYASKHVSQTDFIKVKKVHALSTCSLQVHNIYIANVLLFQYHSTALQLWGQKKQKGLLLCGILCKTLSLEVELLERRAIVPQTFKQLLILKPSENIIWEKSSVFDILGVLSLCSWFCLVVTCLVVSLMHPSILYLWSSRTVLWVDVFCRRQQQVSDSLHR